MTTFDTATDEVVKRARELADQADAEAEADRIRSRDARNSALMDAARARVAEVLPDFADHRAPAVPHTDGSVVVVACSDVRLAVHTPAGAADGAHQMRNYGDVSLLLTCPLCERRDVRARTPVVDLLSLGYALREQDGAVIPEHDTGESRDDGEQWERCNGRDRWYPPPPMPPPSLWRYAMPGPCDVAETLAALDADGYEPRWVLPEVGGVRLTIVARHTGR